MEEQYQRRTQKGIGRMEKITLRGATKNPRLLKACNTTLISSDMGEFFFISVKYEFTWNILTAQRKTIFYIRGLFTQLF
jgi:hypothetical protein